MFGSTVTLIALVGFFNLIFAQTNSVCDTLKDLKGNEIDENNSSLKLQRLRALCDAIHGSLMISDRDDSYSIPDFDLTQIESENDANQILKRFRRGRGGGGGGGRGGGGGGRSGGGGRFGGSRSSSSSRSGGSRVFSSSRSSSSGGSSRIFSRSGSSSGGSSRVVSRSSSASSSSSGGSRLFSRSGTSGSGSHRVRASIRSMIGKSPSSSSSKIAGGSSIASGSKPSFSDKIRKITHGGGGRVGSGGGGHFGIGGSSGSVWVRSGKTFLPHAARFGKRYYQRRKYNQGLYAGAGYYSGAHMAHHGSHYPYGYYGYPPVTESRPPQIDGQTPTVFYCIQEDLNTTLVNQTLDKDGFGVCNVSGKLITCPMEIECKLKEADTCCEDEQGVPFCCGGPIPDEYVSEYGGYADDWRDSAESMNKMLNLITMLMIMMTTICFTIWHRRGC